MSAIVIPNCLTRLVDFLNALESRAPIEQLRHHLTQLDVKADDLTPFSIFGDTCYRRNLISEGPWFELLCICWKSGQRSPIHNHAGSTCGLRIIEGVATETAFETTPCGQIKPTKSVDYEPGLVCCTQDSQIHQVSNLQPANQCLRTLHIYSPPLRTMQTYSLMDGAVGNYTVGQ